MKREILFRGKRLDNGEWVEGFYLYTDEKPAIVDIKCRSHIIVPETLGQSTGLTDKNGKRIFEGDIVHAVYQPGVGFKNVDFGIGVVKYCASYYGGASYCIEIIGKSYSRVFTVSLENGVKVIGNVYDNPELLIKGEQLCFF